MIQTPSKGVISVSDLSSIGLLPKPKTTEEEVFAPRDLYTFADFVRACDIVSDGEGGWYAESKESTPKRVLKVEFELEIENF